MLLTQAQELSEVLKQVRDLRTLVERALAGGYPPDCKLVMVRETLDKWFQATGRYPPFLDVGINVFMEIYDGHVRYRQPIHIAQMAEQRMAIQFVATQLVLRWEVINPNFIGVPRDI
jgi:hypothetical protein